MYQRRRLFALVSVDIALLAALIASTLVLVSGVRRGDRLSYLVAGVSGALVFATFASINHLVSSRLNDVFDHKTLYSGETALITEFIERLRVCYSLDDFYEAIAQVLEQKGDCSVMYIDRSKDYVLYNSPDRLTCAQSTLDTLSLNYAEDWRRGIYFMGSDLGVVTDSHTARGFFLVNDKHHLYVFCRYTRLFDSTIFNRLFDEFCRFQSRSHTIADLSEISSLSKEWQQLADTQQSFLPAVMPRIDHLSVAAYYRPLVNVSGDYYSVLPITPSKTLLMLGDVSGKGLAAALVMGLVMNTVKIMEDKEDLPKMIKAVDKAIKGMKLQDKYTVLFLGIVDTERMTIRYINASMSDPIIITKSPTGYRIKPLTSNCSLVGIIDLDDVDVAEQRLFRGDVILMASDGVSEVMNEEGVELGDTQLYKDTITSSAKKHPKEFINDVEHLVFTYNGDKKLRDDVTMLVAKVEG
ncbi:MAG: SpoIIE family protein phosphatase [Treponema sp.]|nr:SpoIIE family protein phosphatase [Treponema sp.]